jgi:hypothetical protein
MWHWQLCNVKEAYTVRIGSALYVEVGCGMNVERGLSPSVLHG